MKNCEKRCFARVWTSFGLWSNLGLTRGILVILAEKRHFKCSGAQMGFATSFWMLLGTYGEKMIFLNFSGSGTQIKDGQNTVSIRTANL